MFYIISIVSFFVACEKAPLPEHQISGDWQMTGLSYYENDSLKSDNKIEPGTIYYSFHNCETSHSDYCDAVITQDGEVNYYTYQYDSYNKIVYLDESEFKVTLITASELVLEKQAENFKHQYRFERKG